MPKIEVPSGQECLKGGCRMQAPRRAAIMAWQKRRFSAGMGHWGSGSSFSMRLTATGCQRRPSFSMMMRWYSAYCACFSAEMGSARSSSARAASKLALPRGSMRMERVGQLPEQVVQPTQASGFTATGTPSRISST